MKENNIEFCYLKDENGNCIPKCELCGLVNWEMCEVLRKAYIKGIRDARELIKKTVNNDQ